MGYYGGKIMGLSPEPSVLKDGNTLMWYDSKDISTIIKDSSNRVSSWKDKLSSGRDIGQVNKDKMPIFTENGILFDGIDDYLKSNEHPIINQPEYIYAVIKQISFTNNRRIFDGFLADNGTLYQWQTSPNILIYTTGSNTTTISNLATIGTKHIIRILFNGASSFLKVNDNNSVIGNLNISNMRGLTLGCNSFVNTPSNILVSEFILRKNLDTDIDSNLIYNYLKNKYNL